APTRAPAASLVIEGTFAITFEGVPAAGSELRGTFREIYGGAREARHESDMGEHGGLARGTTEDLVWEVEPALGANVYTGVQALTLRRYTALLRGARPSELYASM